MLHLLYQGVTGIHICSVPFRLDTVQHSAVGSIPGLKHLFYYFFKNLFILFIYFWLFWVFVAVRGLSLVAVSGGYSSLRCADFLLQWLLLLRSTGSRCAGFSSCGSRAPDAQAQ